MRTRLVSILSCALALGLEAAYAQPAYLDDRSTPEMLVRSLYNAIDRKEYARAYSYFGTPPAETLEGYAEGYADTEEVEVVTGTPTAEGAAGSVYYAVPVAIRARSADGEETAYAGCYTLRFVQPAVQTTPYQPLFIEKGELQEAEAAEGPLEDLLPPACGEGEAVSTDPLLQKAEHVFGAAFGDVCRADEIGVEEEPERYAIPSGVNGEEVTLFRFLCDRGAYNEGHVYLLADEAGELQPLRFAMPELDIRYENGDAEGSVEEIHVIGYATESMLANSSFNPDDFTITAHAKWRGVGDASSSGVWLFRSGTFSLVRYDVDASLDGEVNQETLIDYFTGP